MQITGMSSKQYIPINYEHLLNLASVMAAHLARSEVTISEWAGCHSRFFSRLRQGKGCSAHAYENVFVWFSSNWPEDLEWPADIPRPAPKIELRRAS